MQTNVIYQEDCLGTNGMCRLPDNSIDMILADLPYGTIQCSWDSIISLELLWEQYKRVIKANGAIVLTASQPFTSKLVMSNINNYRHNWIWFKNRPGNFAVTKYMPLSVHEDILVFGFESVNYYPQMRTGKMRLKGGAGSSIEGFNGLKTKYTTNDLYHPKNVLKYKTVERNKSLHPTQKPTALFEYLIRTYTKNNEVVLDNVIGSGTTAIACLRAGRKFIGFEQEEKYYKIALQRLGKFDKTYYEQLSEEDRPKQRQLF